MASFLRARAVTASPSTTPHSRFNPLASHLRPGRSCVRAGASSSDPNPEDVDHVSSRQVPLPGGQAFWLLDPLQDRYFNVHGQSFIIQRPETFTHIFPKLRLRKLHTRATDLVPVQPANGAEQHTGECTAIIRPTPSIELLPTVWSEEAVIDITECLEQMAADEHVGMVGAAMAPVITPTAPASFGGLVPVPSAPEGEGSADDEGKQEVFVGSSSSPRRTKMIGFTCLRCNARSYKPINPLAFEEGTLVVQCGKCNEWHKIKDHLGLFHELQGDIFVRPAPISMEDIPQSLRLPLAPFYWHEGNDEDSGSDTREGR